MTHRHEARDRFQHIDRWIASTLSNRAFHDDVTIENAAHGVGERFMVIVAIDHEPGRVADAKSIRFDLGVLKQSAIESFDGRYEILPPIGQGPAQRATLRYTAAIELKLPPPPAVGHMAVKHNLEAQLKAVAAEVERRASRAEHS